jgi:type IV pilus assembly protein PilB
MTSVVVRCSQDLDDVLAGLEEDGRSTGAEAPLGQLLLQASLINPRQLEHTLRLQAGARRRRVGYRRLGELLVQLGLVSRRQVDSMLAHKFGIPIVRLPACRIAAEVLARVPRHLVLQYRLLPLAIVNGRLVVASETPWDNDGINLLRFHTGLPLVLVMATRDEIELVVDYYFTADVAENPAAAATPSTAPQTATALPGVEQLEQQANQRPIVRLLNNIIRQGLQRRASDIHIRPNDDMIEVHYRIDGRMHLMRTLASDMLAPLVSRAKIIAHMNIAERRLPQDGHARFQHGDAQADLRLSVIPTVHGESVVIRLLDPANGIKRLDDLGLAAQQLTLLKTLARQRSGLVLVVGPTGAGKSTTLYALLDEIRRDGRHILSVEDPVEYHVDGVEQVQVNERKGLAFSNVLRHFLRHDPDVIMVGEIRDQVTAELALRAALTGHLVLSTLHTNDAPSTITRLLNMGIAPYLISSTLLAVMSQGLIRLNCRSCVQQADVPTGLLRRLGLNAGTDGVFLRGRGCNDCYGSGYRGRRIIAEVMTIDTMLMELINRRAPLAVLRQHAITRGMQPQLTQAWGWVRRGLTTLDELLALKIDNGVPSSRQKARAPRR